MPHYYCSGARPPKTDRHVFIAIPTYGDIKAGCVNSLNAVQHNLVANGVSVDVAILSGNCHVDDARNDLCRMFLESEATHLMFIDADLQFSAESVRTLLAYDEAIIAGVYPYKSDDESYPVVPVGKGFQFDERGLVKVKGVPGGFVMIAREVIQTLYDANKHKGAWPNKGNYGTLPVVEIFHRSIELGRSRRSGDYEFCAKAIEAGYDIWIAPNLRFGHIGDKVHNGCIQDHWFRKNGIYDAAAKDAIARLRSGSNDPLGDIQSVARAFGNEPFAADAILLRELWNNLTPDSRVLETGSGVSTAVIRSIASVVISLESDRSWQGRTIDFLEAVDIDISNDGVEFTPITDHASVGKWYDAKGFDGECDLIFIDGPRRDEAGMRARICDIMTESLTSANTVIVDDTDDADGRALLQRLHDEYGFMFNMHKGPRREFAVGTREAA